MSDSTRNPKVITSIVQNKVAEHFGVDVAAFNTDNAGGCEIYGFLIDFRAGVIMRPTGFTMNMLHFERVAKFTLDVMEEIKR